MRKITKIMKGLSKTNASYILRNKFYVISDSLSSILSFYFCLSCFFTYLHRKYEKRYRILIGECYEINLSELSKEPCTFLAKVVYSINTVFRGCMLQELNTYMENCQSKSDRISKHQVEVQEH